MAGLESKVLDFLKGTVQPYVATGVNVANDIAAPARAAANFATAHTGGNKQAVQLQTPGQTASDIPVVNKMTDNGSLRNQISDIAQVGVDTLAPAITKPVEGFAAPIVKAAAGVGEKVGGKLLSGAGDVAENAGKQIGKKFLGGGIKGASGGAALGGAQGVAQGIGSAQNPQDLTMDFLTGAAKGAEQGAVFGAATAKGSGTPTVAGAIGGLPGQVSRIFASKLNNRAGLVDETDNTIDGYNTSDELVKDAADTYKQIHDESNQGSVLTKIKQAGGISSSDYEDIPSSVKNKNGTTMDEMAGNLGYNSDAELYDAMQDERNKGAMPSTKQGWLDYAKQQLESGKAHFGMSDTYNALLARETGGSPIDDATAADLSTTTDAKEAQDKLEPIVGPAVAKDTAAAVAHTHDPNIVKNIVQNDVQQKLGLGNDLTHTVTDPHTGETRDASEYEVMRAQQHGKSPQEMATQDYNEYQTAMLAKNAPAEQATATSDINSPQQAEAQGTTITPEEQQSLEQSGQQLSPRDVREQPPAFINAPGEEGATHTSKLAGMTNMVDELNSGVAPETAVQHYMETTGDDLYTAQKVMHNAMNSEGLERGNVNADLNPRKGDVSLPGGNSKDAAILNARYAGSKVKEEGQKAVQAVQRLSENDQERLRYLRGKSPGQIAQMVNEADHPEDFADAVQSLKDYNDYTHASGNALGQDIPYRQRYGLNTPYENPAETDTATAQEPLERGMANPNNAAYTKSRVFNTHEEALNNGYRPRNASALEDLQQDISSRSRDQSRLALQQGLENAYPGQVKRISGEQVPAGYHQLLIPNGDHLALPAEIADKMNQRQMYQYADGKAGSLARGYDAANSIGKQAELGGGFFHGFNTMGTFVGQQLASLKGLTDIKATAHVVQNFLSPKATDGYFDNAKQLPSGGVDETHSLMDGAQATGLNLGSAQDIAKPGEEGIAGKVANIPGLKQVHEAVFERQIPTMMLETFRQKTQGLDIFGSAEDREQGIKIAKQINKEFGTIDHDIQGLTPKQFKAAGRFLLAPSYQEGQVGSLLDAISKGGAEGKLAREAVFGKALLFGGLATVGAAAGGDFKGQTPSQVALSIMHKMVNPQFNIGGYTVSTPATQISEFVKPVETTMHAVQGGKSVGQGVLSGAESFANSRAAFLPAQAEQQFANKDFAGNALHGSDFYGRPISRTQDALNELKNVSPIPVSQAGQVAGGKENLAAAAANVAGLSTRPQFSAQYAPVAGQTYLASLQGTSGVTKDQINADTEYFDLLEQGVKGKNQTIKAAATAMNQKNPQKADQLIKDYNQQLIKTLMPWAQDKGKSQYLDSTMLQLLQTAELKSGTISRDAQYYAKTNPTAYGAQIKTLASNPVPTPV